MYILKYDLLSLPPLSPSSLSLLFTGLVAIEMTVSVLVEIMCTVSLEFPDLLHSCIPHWVKLLTAQVSYFMYSYPFTHVQVYC